MLIENGDGRFTAGPLDVLFIYHNVDAGTFHPAFYEEHPMPGPVKPFAELDVVRLKSKLHHTTGFATLDEARAELASMRERITIHDLNVKDDEPFPWDGVVGDVMVVPNWRKASAERTFQFAV